MTEKVGRLFRAVPSLTRLPVSRKTSLVRDADGLNLVTETDLTGVREAIAAERDRQPHMLVGTQRHHRHVAEIPNDIYFKLCRELGPPKHNREGWARWLNDPDNRDFRVWAGTV